MPWWLSGKDSVCNAGNAGDVVLIPGLGRSPGGGNGKPFQCSCLENLTDRGAWLTTVHGVAKSWVDWAHTHTIHSWFNSLSRRKGQVFCFCPFGISSEKPKVVCRLQLESVRDVLSPYSFFLFFYFSFFLFLSFFFFFLQYYRFPPGLYYFFKRQFPVDIYLYLRLFCSAETREKSAWLPDTCRDSCLQYRNSLLADNSYIFLQHTLCKAISELPFQN